MDILKNLLCAVGVIVFTVGLCALFNRLLLLTVRPKCGEKAFTVVMLDDEMKSPALIIRYLLIFLFLRQLEEECNYACNNHSRKRKYAKQNF